MPVSVDSGEAARFGLGRVTAVELAAVLGVKATELTKEPSRGHATAMKGAA